MGATARATWAVGIAIVALAACTPTGSTAPPSSEPASEEPASTAPPIADQPQLTAAIVQERVDVPAGEARIAVTNESAAEVVVDHAEYRSSALAEPLVAGDGSRIPPGSTRALRGTLPAPTCDDAPLRDEVVVVLADGTEVALEPEDPYEQIPTLTDVACDRLAVAEVAVVEVSVRIPEDVDDPAELVVRATPTGSGEATLATISSTPLLALVDDAGERAQSLPLDLAVVPGGAAQEATVPIRPARCDAHAIAEDKQGTLWRIAVDLDGERVQLVQPSSDADREALLAFVADACGIG